MVLSVGCATGFTVGDDREDGGNVVGLGDATGGIVTVGATGIIAGWVLGATAG